MAGALPQEVKRLMRHSSIQMTMDTYGHLFPGQDAQTVGRLPDMMGDTGEALRATGTADQIGNHLGDHTPVPNWQDLSTTVATHTPTSDAQSLEDGKVSQELATPGKKNEVESTGLYVLSVYTGN